MFFSFNIKNAFSSIFSIVSTKFASKLSNSNLDRSVMSFKQFPLTFKTCRFGKFFMETVSGIIVILLKDKSSTSNRSKEISGKFDNKFPLIFKCFNLVSNDKFLCISKIWLFWIFKVYMNDFWNNKVLIKLFSTFSSNSDGGRCWKFRKRSWLLSTWRTSKCFRRNNESERALSLLKERSKYCNSGKVFRKFCKY